MRTVSDAYPESGRSANSWTVHMIFAGQSDRTELVSREKLWTVSEARAEVTSRNAPDGDGDGDSDGDSDGDESAEVDEIEATKANIARLEGELITARAHLAKLEAARPAPAPSTIHSPAGIPQHDASDNRPDCKLCKLAAAPRTSRTRNAA